MNLFKMIQYELRHVSHRYQSIADIGIVNQDLHNMGMLDRGEITKRNKQNRGGGEGRKGLHVVCNSF